MHVTSFTPQRCVYIAVWDRREKGDGWYISVCYEGVEGSKPVPEYGPYATQEGAEMLTNHLNGKHGLMGHEAVFVLMSALGKPIDLEKEPDKP